MRTRGEKKARWEALFGNLSRVKDIVWPAYEAAFVPVIGGAIHFTKKPHVKVLVVGGGRGNNSKRLAPAVRKWLQAKGQNVKLEIVETDIAPEISKAAGVKSIANMAQLPFRASSFDFVVSESAVHQAQPKDLSNVVSEFKRVLKSDGIVIHLQENTPDHTVWAPVESRCAGVGRAILHSETLNPGEQSTFLRVSEAAHENLRRSLRLAAIDNELRPADFKITGTARFPITHKLPHLPGGLDPSSGNVLFVNYGAAVVLKDPKVRKGEREITFSAPVHFMSKSLSTRDLIAHIEAHR
ncbi:MAG: class I SAM-dependent methyltransferase [Candidatus Micrarchaeota archaeon]|nr:class I SAM-dependent methyltransferase [Candidatus Micrarchaeota archaeon]